MNPVEKNTGPSPVVSRAPTDAQDRVLAALALRHSATTLAELAEMVGLHENTLRGHLDALHKAGHVSRLRATPRGRGRPAWAYVAREQPYAALARALASGLERNPRATAGETATSGGRAWAEQLRELIDEDDETPHQRLMLVLEHVGFGPESSADGKSIRLTRCPFIGTARAHPEAVCGVHLGLIEGVWGASLGPAALQPFAEPGACLVTLPPPATPE